jgi:hypothetical protein
MAANFDMTNYPSRDNLDFGQWKCCQVEGCGKDFAKFSALVKHLQGPHHQVPKEDMTGHWLSVEVNRERRGKVLSEEEAHSVDLVWAEDGQVDEVHFLCKLCGHVLQKRSCCKHMVGQHSMAVSEVQKWLTSKDGQMLKKHVADGLPNTKLELTVGILSFQAEHEEDVEDLGQAAGAADDEAYEEVEVEAMAEEEAEVEAEDDDDYYQDAALPEEEDDQGYEIDKVLGNGSSVAAEATEAADITRVVSDGSIWRTMWVRVGQDGQVIMPLELQQISALEHAQASPTITLGSSSVSAPGIFADIKAQLAAAVGPKQIEVKLPKVGISTIFNEWKQPEKEAKRYSCPIPCSSTMDFTSFSKYLKGAGQKQVSIDENLMNIKRFFNLLTIEEGAFDPIGVLCSVYQGDILQKLMDAPLMGFQFSWSRKIIWALDHFCSHLKVCCNRKRYLEARTTIQQLEDEVLSAYKKSCLKARKVADQNKFHLDASRLDQFPSSEEAKEAVLKAMVSLASLSHETIGKPQLSFNEKLNATTAMVGIIHYNSFAGRSGEWQSMTRKHVEEQIALGKDYLLCPKHKTSDTYGTLAKYVPAGSMKAMAVYMGLPGKAKDLMLEPANSQSLQVSIAQHLQRFGKLFLGKVDPPNSNLIRKQYHTQLLRMSREGQAMDFMKKIDAHSAEVAQKVYATTTPSDDSKLGKALFQQLFGEPVEWPSQEIITATKVPDLSQQCQLVLFTGDCGEQEGQGEEDEEEEEELEFILTADEVEMGSGLQSLGEEKRGSTSQGSKDHTDGEVDGELLRMLQDAADQEEVAPAGRGSSSSARAIMPGQTEGKQDRNDTKKKHEKKDKKEKQEKKDKREHDEKGERHTTPENLRAFFGKKQKDNALMVEPAAVPSIKVEPAAVPSKRAVPAAEPSVQPAPAKKHKGSFTNEQKAWIVAEANKWGVECPPNCELRSILQRGIDQRKLSSDTNLEQVRHICRTR